MKAGPVRTGRDSRHVWGKAVSQAGLLGMAFECRLFEARWCLRSVYFTLVNPVYCTGPGAARGADEGPAEASWCLGPPGAAAGAPGPGRERVDADASASITGPFPPTC